jgi:hypothetical protein
MANGKTPEGISFKNVLNRHVIGKPTPRSVFNKQVLNGQLEFMKIYIQKHPERANWSYTQMIQHENDAYFAAQSKLKGAAAANAASNARSASNNSTSNSYLKKGGGKFKTKRNRKTKCNRKTKHNRKTK